jgi:hypothetical protein
MVKKFLTLLLPLLAVSLALPAVSAAGKSACPSSALCLWQNYAYGGIQWTYSINSWPQDQWDYVGGEANDRTSSLYNNRVHAALISQNANPATEGGGIACVAPGQSYEDLSGLAWPQSNDSANDSISGFVLYSNVASCSGSPVLKVRYLEGAPKTTTSTESQVQNTTTSTESQPSSG